MCYDCEKTKEKLSEFIDNTLDDSESEAVKEHIASCASCAGEYNELSLLIKELNMLPEAPLPADFNEKLHHKLVAEAKPLRHINISINWRRYSVLAAGLLIAVMIRAGYYNNVTNLKTAYVDDAVLQTAPDNGRVEPSTPMPSASADNAIAFTHSTAQQKQRKSDSKSSANIKTSDTGEIPASAEPPKEEAQTAPPEDIQQIQEQNRIVEAPAPKIAEDNTSTEERTFAPLDSMSSGASAKMAPSPLPSQSPAPTASPPPDASISRAFMQQSELSDNIEQEYVSVIVKVDSFDEVSQILKEKYKASALNGSITLELDTDKYTEVIDLLSGYNAEITYTDTEQPLTSNKCVVTAK